MTEPATFRSADAASRFERRALAAIRHATRHGLFTAYEAATMVDRVHALTAEPITALTARIDDAEGTHG